MVFRQNRSDYTVSIPISLGAIEWNRRFWRENILSNIKIGTDGTFIWLDNHDLHAVFLSFLFLTDSTTAMVGGHSPIATTPIYSFIKLLEMWSRGGQTTEAKKTRYFFSLFRMNSTRLSRLCYPMSSRLPIRGSTCKRPRGNTLKSTRKGCLWRKNAAVEMSSW